MTRSHPYYVPDDDPSQSTDQGIIRVAHGRYRGNRAAAVTAPAAAPAPAAAVPAPARGRAPSAGQIRRAVARAERLVTCGRRSTSATGTEHRRRLGDPRPDAVSRLRGDAAHDDPAGVLVAAAQRFVPLPADRAPPCRWAAPPGLQRAVPCSRSPPSSGLRKASVTSRGRATAPIGRVGAATTGGHPTPTTAPPRTTPPPLHARLTGPRQR